MSKSAFRAAVVAWMALGGPASASDAVSYVSVSRFFPYETSPHGGFEAQSQSFQFAVFFEDTFATVFGWDVGQTASRRMAFTAGAQWYVTDTQKFDPYVTAKFLYQLDGNNHPGWRATAGVEWNARPLSNMDNLRFFLESGASYVFSDPREVWWEMAHLGAAWRF